jgi:hypothetical protein
MSEQSVILSPTKPRRQDARDLQSRLYRELGLEAVAVELFGPGEGAQSTMAELVELPRSAPAGAAALREDRAA